MKIVLDTNVLLAAFASRGLCEAVFEVCLASHELFLSEHILGELQRHLGRKLNMPPRQVGEIVTFLRDQSTIVEPARVPASACRDKADLPVLGTAQAASADCLVTGDNDLLELREFRGIPILTPRAFHDTIG